MKSTATSVDEYLQDLSDARRQSLQKIRELIHQHAPETEEKMQYGMPVYALKGPLFILADKGEFLTLLVAEKDVVDKYVDELDEKGLLYIGNGSIRFKSVADMKLDVLEDVLIEAYLQRKADIEGV